MREEEGGGGDSEGNEGLMWKRGKTRGTEKKKKKKKDGSDIERKERESSVSHATKQSESW